MYNGIKSIDHPVVAVSDMEASRKVYEKLGFLVPPRGSHVEWGTGNWCIMFEDDYLELRGILDPERYTINLDSVLEQFGEGLMGVAFGTDSAEENHNEMVKNGLNPKELKYLGRNFELPEGWVQPRFALCFPNDEDITGLMHVVLCQHLTPELIRKPEYLIHPNRVVGVDSMWGVIEDIDQVESAQQRLLGKEAVQRVGEGLLLTTPSDQTIHLLSKDEYEKRFGDLSKPAPNGEKTYLGAITLKVDDLTKTKQCLENNNIPFEHSDDEIQVAADFTCGVVMTFIES